MKMYAGWSRTAQGAILAVFAGTGIWGCGGSGTANPPLGGSSSGSSGSGPDNSTSSSSSGGGSGSGASSSSGTGSSSGSGSGGSGAGSSSGTSGSSGVGGSSGASGGSSGGASSSGSSSSGAGSSGSSSGAGSSSSSSSSGGQTSNGPAAFSPDRVTVTGVWKTTTPTATSIVNLHNGGPTAVSVMGLAISATSQLLLGPTGSAVTATSTPITGAPLFQIVSPTTFPAMIPPNMDLPVTVELMTNAANLPAPPSDKNLGAIHVGAMLTATLSSGGTAVASVYGIVNSQANYEPTLGQILISVGYKLNVGKAQNNWNPNTSMMATSLPGIEMGTDEVPAPHFVKAGTGNVTMNVVARFSPYGVLPYGWYPKGSSTTHTVVGTMSMATDPQTNDKARMVNPPLAAGSSTTFDPGTATFGLWVYSDQASLKYQPGGNTINGDYDFTEDAFNSPANVHRYKTYPLKDASGASIAQSYLVAVEEAGNGDYQDYVFVLGNVNAAP